MEKFFGTSGQSCAWSIELSRLLHGSISSKAIDFHSKERERKEVSHADGGPIEMALPHLFSQFVGVAYAQSRRPSK